MTPIDPQPAAGIDPRGWFSRLESRLGETGVLMAFLVPSLIVVGIAQFYPLGYSAVISFFDWTLSRSPVVGPFVGFANYTKAFADPVFSGSLAYTVVFAFVSTALQLGGGLGLALMTVGERSELRLIRTLLMLPMVVAPVAVGTIWRMILSGRVGPLNRTLAAFGIDGPDWLGDPLWAQGSLIAIDAWEWMPFTVIILTAALTSLPSEVLRAASVDGAGRWQILRHIVIPMIMPIIVLVAMFRLIDGLLTLDIVFTTTSGGPGYATHTLSFWIYQQGLRYFNISYAAAASWLLLAASMGVALVFLLWRHRLMAWQSAARR
ncbi:MAG: sugar ABC transporter permease [Devosia sp.]|nr:sugar ABC transporter permease [Devosia sp.]